MLQETCDDDALSSISDGMLTILEVDAVYPDFLDAFARYLRDTERPEAGLACETLATSPVRCLRYASSFMPPDNPNKPLSYCRCVASHSYHGAPRFDFVQVDAGDDGQWYGQLEAIFKYDAIGFARVDQIALLHVWDTKQEVHPIFKTATIKCSANYQIVPIASIDYRVLVKSDFRTPCHMFVHK